jgi:hypothetical protein
MIVKKDKELSQPNFKIFWNFLEGTDDSDTGFEAVTSNAGAGNIWHLCHYLQCD